MRCLFIFFIFIQIHHELFKLMFLLLVYILLVYILLYLLVYCL